MNFISVFVKYRTLVSQLVMRDIKTKYRRSVLGLVWTVLNPLLMMTVLSVVFSQLLGRGIDNFPVYIMCGQVIFNFFNEATSVAMSAIIHSGELIKKVYVPKYLFPVAKVMSSAVNLCSSLVALVIVMMVTRVEVTPTLLLVIFPLFYAFVFSLGLSLFLSAVAVSFRDIVHLYGVITTAWMYLTPIIYPDTYLDSMPAVVGFVVAANPLTAFVTMFRDVVLYGVVPANYLHVQSIIWCVAMLVLGSLTFRKAQDTFILKI